MTDIRSITWLGSAGLRLDLADGRRIYVDPWLDSPALPDSERDISRIDAILVTHAHVDHAGSVPELSARFQGPVYAQTELSAWLVERGAVAGLPLGMNAGGTAEVCGIAVTMVPAVHTSASDGQTIGSACGYVLEAAECSVYIAGDTDVFGDMALIQRLYRPTLAVLPVGGLMTMGPRQAALAFELLGRPAVLPYHWGAAILPGTPGELRRLVGTDLAERIIDVRPGEAVLLADLILPAAG